MFNVELLAKNQELNEVKVTLKALKEETTKIIQEAQDAQAKSEEEANTATIRLIDKETELNLLKKERLTSKRKSFTIRCVSNRKRRDFLEANTYENSMLKELKGASTSAQNIQEALDCLGFQCSLNINKTFDEMRKDLLKWKAEASSGGAPDTALLLLWTWRYNISSYFLGNSFSQTASSLRIVGQKEKTP